MEVDDVILIESQLRESMDWTEELKKIKSVGTLLRLGHFSTFPLGILFIQFGFEVI